MTISWNPSLVCEREKNQARQPVPDATSQGNLPVKGATADHEDVAHELRRTGHEVNVISLMLSVRVGGHDETTSPSAATDAMWRSPVLMAAPFPRLSTCSSTVP